MKLWDPLLQEFVDDCVFWCVLLFGQALVLLLYKGQIDKRIKGGDVGVFMSFTVSVKL